MKLPRDIDGLQLAKALRSLGYQSLAKRVLTFVLRPLLTESITRQFQRIRLSRLERWPAF